MKITVIHGTQRHGSTWHCAQTLLDALSARIQPEVTVFTLPKDLPAFCAGCFTCFEKGEDACPHAAHVQPIAKAILASDLVVLTSPVYAMDVAAPLKNLLDHLCYLWMSHRPDPAVFRKLGVVVATTAGAGLGYTCKTMRNSLKFMGFKKQFRLAHAVSAMRWEDVQPKTRLRIEKQAQTISRQIVTAAANPTRLRKPFFRSFFFTLMASMQKKNDWNPTDRAHWERHGWLAGKKPF